MPFIIKVSNHFDCMTSITKKFILLWKLNSIIETITKKFSYYYCKLIILIENFILRVFCIKGK